MIRTNMQLSVPGMLEIVEHEGIVPAPYYDSARVLTFGVGHTAMAGEPNPAEMDPMMPVDSIKIQANVDFALVILAQDLAKYVGRVNDAIRVPIHQHEFDALVSFDYNTGGIYRAKLTDAINNRDPDASEHFFGWLKPPEIYKRREAERRLFETGNYDRNGHQIAVWGTNSRRQLTQIIDRMDSRTLADRFFDVNAGKDLAHILIPPDRQPDASPIVGEPADTVAVPRAIYTETVSHFALLKSLGNWYLSHPPEAD